MRVISLGWGVQSWALAAMSALGMLPKVDAAIHADTTHERFETYEFAKRWTPWLEERGVRVVTVTGPRTNLLELWKTKPSILLPAFMRHEDGRASGVLRRQCTSEWKITPIRRWLQISRNKQPVELWLGITLDEVTRMRNSDVKYITNEFPFIDALGRPWTRTMVLQWLKENDLEVPVKSSCIFCPYHDKATWRAIKQGDCGDWEKALAIDSKIRNKRSGFLCYFTQERRPLGDCDFRSQQDHGQLTLWDEECKGMCFL